MSELIVKLERVKKVAVTGRSPLINFCGDMGKMSNDATIHMQKTFDIIKEMLSEIIGEINETENTCEDRFIGR